MRLAATIVALLLASPATSQTLHGTDIQLREGSILPAATPVLENASGTLRLERGTLGELAPGRSAGLSGTQLQGGVVPLPEPAGALPASMGLLALLSLSRRSLRI